MAKHKRTLQQRKRSVPPRVEYSILIRSAESIGRIIGSLQRQIDDVSRLLGSTNGDAEPRHRTPKDASRDRPDGRARANGRATAASSRPRHVAAGTAARTTGSSPRPSATPGARTGRRTPPETKRRRPSS